MSHLEGQFQHYVSVAVASPWDGRPCDDNYSIGYSHGGGTPHTPMTCATCGVQYPWTPRHFPRMMMATCWECTMKEYQPPKLPWWRVAP